jgi:RNA polymerase sigma factor (sigma-70 family)
MRPRYRPGTAGRFRAWLFSIAHHAVTDVYREQLRRPVTIIEEAGILSGRIPDPADQVISNLDATTVWEALAQLSEEHRRIVELRLAGLTDREIAAALGKSHGAIRMSQMRAVAACGRCSCRPMRPSVYGGEPNG